MKYHFKVHKEKVGGYWAECIELDGCQTQADSMDELKKNMQEALNLYLDEPEGSRVILPFPKKLKKAKGLVGVPVEPRVAFAFLLRQLRRGRGWTQKEAAARLQFNNLYTYQRLESSRTVNPELKTIVQIKKVFPEFSVDEVLSA